jgi:hypothetical protein
MKAREEFPLHLRFTDCAGISSIASSCLRKRAFQG